MLLKRKLFLIPGSSESMIIHDIIEDLARGIARHGHLSEDESGGVSPMARFALDVSRCGDIWQVARAFKHSPPLDAYLMVPYFTAKDLATLEAKTGESKPTG
jgi:hypothetical protein